MSCKVILNADSGNCSRLDIDKLLSMLGCVDTEIETIDKNSDWNANGFDTVIVCGGDGTLHNAIEKCQGKQIIYAPCGTLNEAARTSNTITSVGSVNDDKFSYVCATGSFTEIGYSARNDNKKRYKSLAYVSQVLKNYKCKQISAKLDVDGKIINGEFTLLMILKSHRCFGLPFNKCYKKKNGLYLVAIRSIGSDNLMNRAKMFFPFFRVFFCGVRKPCERRNWLVLPFDNLTVTLKNEQAFCVDGEKRVLKGDLRFAEHTLDKQINVVKTPFLRRSR